MYHYTASGLDNVFLKNGYSIKETPSGQTTSIKNIDGLHKIIARDLVTHEYPLTGKEFCFLRIELNLSQKALGTLFEKSDQAIALWEKGTSKIPALADKAIRDLYMESIGESHIANLLERFSQVDRRVCELELRLEETENGWEVLETA
ncbi:helix-turn-helix domain-containing protein [Aliidiomarina quisquiliarum]|uniref:helix-turn-helix domain-containing protein n=1 Tax=Aliidiomarina quisquiliarum TaxID=2938947 RepID=UPI00208FA9DE|nr:transcriptional regulator [Aliidiomarina quisquiliarum]MCO4320810.1 transcriptional regulator [Aliidiomarina quisquiliarum]